MSMRIGSSPADEQYNLNRIGLSEESLKTSRAEQVRNADAARAVPSLSAEELLSLSRANRGVVQTRVSPENSFQKTMVNDPSYAYERMAAKLMDKLPRILDDMAKLPKDDSYDVVLAAKKADMKSGAEKVVISEDGRISGQTAAAPETENFSL